MVLNGSLAITVHRIEAQLPPPIPGDDAPPKHEAHNVQFTLGGARKHTKFNKSQDDADIEDTLNFDLDDVRDDEAVLMEINTQKAKKGAAPLVANKVPLSNFIANMKNIVITFTVAAPTPRTVRVYLSSQWAPAKAASASASAAASTSTTSTTTTTTTTSSTSAAGTETEETKVVAVVETAQAVEGAKKTLLGSPQTTLALHETHRPWFLRASYYYDTTKHVYAYTTSFRVVSGLARFGESSVNVVLQKVSGKSLHDLDAQLLVPVLGSLDDKVDATLSVVVSTLSASQQFVLKKKDAATARAARAAATTASGVGKAKRYTTGKVVNASSAVYSKAAAATEYTTSTVANVSASTYKTAKGATVAVLSHVPYLGAKIRA